jgi:hypothetical protein
MRLIHKGIRPIADIEVLDFKRKLYIEELPDGTYRVWTKKQLNSGCNLVTRSLAYRDELMGCFYCKHCNEWFSKDQWEKESEKSSTP